MHTDHHSHSENCSPLSSKDVSDVNYITAVQKSSFERSISDSVLSLRNYSTILHASNYPLCKTQSPCRDGIMERALVRQTSTPMHHNLGAIVTPSQPQPPHSNGSCCRACFVSSTSSGQMSCSNSSSDSNTNINIVAKPNDMR